MQGSTTAEDVLRLVLAGGRLAAEPGVQAADLDRVVVRLISRDAGVDSDGSVQRMVSDLLLRLWQNGWQPADVVHVVRRRATQRAGRLVSAVIAGVPAGVSPAWQAQLDRLEVPAGSVTDWWRAERVVPAVAWREVLRVVGVLRSLPPIERLTPPPSGSSATQPPLDPGAPDERALSRIRGLLAKAESTEFAAEAEALTARPQELMARYAIDTAVLAGRGEGAAGSATVGVRRFHLDDPHAEAKASVVHAVARANGVRVVLMPGSASPRWWGWRPSWTSWSCWSPRCWCRPVAPSASRPEPAVPAPGPPPTGGASTTPSPSASGNGSPTPVTRPEPRPP
ncbi:DUF2786 domain-containing protein [Modestobacter sp. I12A-02662]|uniref:DUF2786 domain-containing protein n=1 Tax=Modestobacter sp. I12A-02662 TaxID=1730496 RepID=UPI0034DEF27C